MSKKKKDKISAFLDSMSINDEKAMTHSLTWNKSADYKFSWTFKYVRSV